MLNEMRCEPTSTNYAMLKVQNTFPTKGVEEANLELGNLVVMQCSLGKLISTLPIQTELDPFPNTACE